MGLFIHLLVIVMIVKSQAELQVASSGNEQDTCSKVHELKTIVSIYLNTVNTELSTTRHQLEELKDAVSANQETVSSELEDANRKMDELQVAVSGNRETVTSQQRNVEHQLEELQTEVFDTKQQLIQLQVSVSTIVNLLQGTNSTDEAFTSEAAEGSKLVTTPEAVGPTFPKDCSEILAGGESMSGVYTVQPLDSGEAFRVYCDMETDGGGWTLFQRRQDGSVNFYLDFASYSRGFGDLEREFWLGNDNLHRLTAQGEYELRIDLLSFENTPGYAVYDSFSIADVSDNYRLVLGEYSGTAGDGLAYHNHQAFTTKDRDNDKGNINCAVSYHGAWWYTFCVNSNLNGRYFQSASLRGEGMQWYSFANYRSLKTTEMKIRSKL